MTSEQRRQESEAYWFRSPAARNVLEDFMPSREDEETILDEGGPEPEPIPLTPTTNLEDVVRNEPEVEPEAEAEPEVQNPLFFSDADRTRLQGKLKEQGLDRIKASDPFPQAPRGLGGEAGAGFSRGIDQTQAMGFGLLGLMGEVLEVEGLSDLGVEGYKRNMEEAAKNIASVQDPFEEIGGVGDAALYATGVLSEQLPQLMLSLLGGGIGGVAAKTVAKKVIANEIGKRVTAGMAKEEAEKVVAKLVAQKALQGFDVPVVREGVERVASGIGQEAMQQATRAGALGGAYVANVGQIAGGSFGEIEQETGLRDPVNALGFALVGGALETGAEALMLAPVANKLIGRGVENAAVGMSIGPRAQTALRLASSPAAEGGTEYVQTFTEQAAVASADPNRTLAEVALTPEAERERQIAGAAGVVAGGGFAAASQAASYLIPETSRRVNEVLQRRQQQQGQEEQPPAGVLTGDWSQPVDVGGIKMQRSSNGTWAALNPPEDLDPAAPRNQLPDGTNVVVLRAAAGENNAWLINEAESALSDLNEGKFEEPPPLPQNQEEQEIDEEDQLDTPAELRELEEGLGIGTPVKSAEESARVIDDTYTEEERRRQSPFALRYMERRIAVENARKERENQRMLDWGRVMAREPNESISFVNGLIKGESKVSIASLGKEPGEEGFTETTGVFAGRRNNGNAIFYISKLGPRASGPVGPNQGRIELKPEQFNRVTLARPDADTRPLVSPFEETMRDLLGNNPSKQEAGQALGSPFTGKGAPQETTIRNRVGGGPIPVLVRWFNKKGEKGTVIPTFKGKFTNSPLTTVFQMNEGLEVIVPDDQVADLSPDIQVEAVSDKKGGRKNIVTAVNLWGRTYRRSLKSPKDFSVDEGFSYEGRKGEAERRVVELARSGKMAQEKAASLLSRTDEFGNKTDGRKVKARKRGLWIFDEIYRNSPQRIEASEAGRQAAATRQGGPLEAQLIRVAGNIEKLDSVENTFYQDDFERATDFLENSNLNEEEKRLAQKMAQDKIVLAYEKIARSSRGAPFRTEGRDQIARRLTEVLAELRAEALADAKDKALDSIYGDVRGAREIRSAQTRVNRLTGKALGSVRQQSPARSLEKLGTAQRSLAKNPNETQKQAFEDLENFLEGQALSGQAREKIEKGILDRIEKGSNAMLNKAKSRLEKELTQGLKGREKGEIVRAINQVADRYRRLKNFNPIGIATRAAFSAKRSIRRDAANAPIEPSANLEQVLQAPPPQAIGQRQQAGDTQKGTGERTEDSPFEVLAKKEESQSKPADTIEDGQERFTRLSNEDIDLILRSRGMLENEQGGQIRGQISTLTSAQKKRAKQITNYLIGKTTYETLYPESANRGGDARAVVADADAGQRRTGEVLSGATQSVARRTANPNPPRGSDRVGGRNQGAAGTVQESAVQPDGGSGVPAPLDPQTIRERARAATRRFVQSFARLTDAEAAARSDVEIERARQAILNERDPAEAVANRVAISSVAASVADLASRSNADLLRGAAAEIAREQADRDAVNTARENLGALLRSGAFADANSFIDSVAANTRLPRDMAMRAKEFTKLARRGINFNNVGIQIGRFGPDTSWAGYLSGADGSYNIAINLDAVHDRDSVVNTMLHELQHVVLKEKVARRIPLNRVEQEALDRLEGIRRDTVVRAARGRGLSVPDQPSDADVARLSEELYKQSLPDVENADRALASLRNLDEFVVEVSSNPELADLMVRLGFGQGKGQVTMLGALKNAWDSLVQFITGVKADPNSPLAKAFKDSWIVSFANSGADVNLEEYTIPEVRRTAMADELAKLAEINAFIDARIQQDNLAGTTEDRNRLLAEWSNQNKKAKATTPRKAKRQSPPEKKEEPPKKKEEPPKKKETLPKKQQEPPKKKEKPPKKKDAPLPNDPKEQLLTFIREENRGVVKTPSGEVQAGTRIYKKARAKDGTFKEGRGGGFSQTAHWVTRVTGDKEKTVYTLFAPIAIDGSKQDQWTEQVAYPEKEFIELIKDGDIEVETDPSFPVGIRKEIGTRIISMMPAATQADPTTVVEINEEPLMSVAVRRATSQDREKWRRMRLAGARARNRELDRIVDRMIDDDLPSFDSQTQREMDEASIEESADGSWQEESLSIPERYQVSIKEWREWANLIAENKVPNDPRYQSELERARRDLAGSRSGITPEKLTELRLRVLDPDLQELDALDMGLQFYAGPRPILWGGPAFPNFLRDPRMRVAAQENSEVSETEDFEVALDSFDKWISPAANSENPAISNAASRLREAFIDAFGPDTPEQATGDTEQATQSVARGRPVDTASDKFKQWFKKSAVTNRLVGGRDDEPLRMYHGSPFDLKSVFRSEADIQREKGVSRWGDNPKLDPEDVGNEGIYFTPDPRYANAYTRSRYGAQGANTTPVYLSIQNPYYVNEQDTWWENISRYFNALKAAAKSIAKWNPEPWDEFEARDSVRFFGRRLDNINDPLSATSSSGYIAPKELKLLREQGYDGIINLAPDGNVRLPEIIVFSSTQVKSAITNTGEFSSTNPNINESVARSRRPFASETATTYNGKTYTRPGLIFDENANLDPRATELVAILKRVKRAAEQYANLKGRELNRLIKKYYKDQPVPTDLINDALGNLDNPLTDQQFDEVKRLELTDPEAAVAKRMAYISENRARFRTERQAPALLALPEELAEFLREIGGSRETPGDLYRLQEEALKLGIPKGDMAVAFTENLGIYLTRSYNAFIDQEGWERTLRAEDAALGEQSRMGQFRNQIRSTLIGQRADELLTKAQTEGRTLSRAEAERLAKEGTTTEEVDQMLESYIAYTKEEASSESFSGLRLPGRQNIKSLEQRKRLSDALREFYGQVENPAVNFVTSYAKLSSLIANHQFQTGLKNLGLKEGWIWDPEKNPGQRPPAGYERIAADNDKSLKVLAGLYARSDLVRGLRETFPPNSMEAAQWWLHPFMKLTGLSMGMKTVGSIASQIRNYWSSYAPLIAGGNFTIADLFRPEWRKNWKEAHGVSIANVFRQYKGDRNAITNRIKRLYELGVMGESLTVGLLNDLTRLGKDASISDEQFFNNFEKILKKPGRRVWNATKQVWEKAEQIYGMTDDIFKIFTYLSEFDKYKKVYPNMSEAELEQKAANTARDIHWTYSKAPAVVNELKKFPFIAPFITFTTETIRITANLGKLAINERKEGQRLREQGLRENNAELVRQGDELLKISNKRMRGMAAVAVGPWALGTLAATSLGFSGDDEEDLRQFLPDWQKNSQLIIIGKNGSEVNYVDVSYLDPFEVWKKPMTAFMRGLGRAENVEQFFTEAVVGAAIEAGRPFTSEQILSGAIMDVMRNRDANGRQVYNPQDTGASIANAVGKKLASAFAPGTVDTGDRIVKAIGGQISETGRDYNLANEVFGVPLGSRVSAVDAEQALGFKASQFLRARRDARSIFNRDYLSRGSRSESDVISAYQRSNAGLRDVTEQLRREYIAALNLGVSPAKARSILRAAGLDRDSARMVSTGIYRRLTPSEEQDRMAAPERKRAAREAIAETPQREVLFP